MTPEERASGVIEVVSDHMQAFYDADTDNAKELLRSWIASAIRAAENEALERAAKAANNAQLGRSCFADQYGQSSYNEGCRAAEQAIRSLKSKDTQ